MQVGQNSGPQGNRNPKQGNDPITKGTGNKHDKYSMEANLMFSTTTFSFEIFLQFKNIYFYSVVLARHRNSGSLTLWLLTSHSGDQEGGAPPALKRWQVESDGSIALPLSLLCQTTIR